MKMTSNRKKAGGLALVALVGWTTSVWLPPEVAADVFGGVMGLF